jgi:hypothetical protein
LSIQYFSFLEWSKKPCILEARAVDYSFRYKRRRGLREEAVLVRKRFADRVVVLEFGERHVLAISPLATMSAIANGAGAANSEIAIPGTDWSFAGKCTVVGPSWVRHLSALTLVILREEGTRGLIVFKEKMLPRYQRNHSLLGSAKVRIDTAHLRGGCAMLSALSNGRPYS